MVQLPHPRAICLASNHRLITDGLRSTLPGRGVRGFLQVRIHTHMEVCVGQHPPPMDINPVAESTLYASQPETEATLHTKKHETARTIVHAGSQIHGIIPIRKTRVADPPTDPGGYCPCGPYLLE